MRIKPNEFYSGMQAIKLTGASNRQAVTKHIKSGALRAITVQGDGGGGIRYAIKGEWLMSFNERNKKGLINAERYTVHELKEMLQGAVDYCKLHNITTLKELIISINKLK